MSLWRNPLRNSRLLELLRSQSEVVVGEVDLANGTLVAFIEEAQEVVEDVPDDQTTMLVSAALGALASVVVASAAAYWCLRRYKLDLILLYKKFCFKWFLILNPI